MKANNAMVVVKNSNENQICLFNGEILSQNILEKSVSYNCGRVENYKFIDELNI